MTVVVGGGIVIGGTGEGQDEPPARYMTRREIYAGDALKSFDYSDPRASVPAKIAKYCFMVADAMEAEADRT